MRLYSYKTLHNVVPNPQIHMYCFEMRVRDKNGDVGTFVVLDGEGTKIAGRSVRDVLNEYMEVYFSLPLLSVV